MMLNQLPKNVPIKTVLNFLGTSPRYCTRNRALYAIRQELRIKDIAALQVADILTPDLEIVEAYVSDIDGTRFELSNHLRSELRNYLCSFYGIAGVSLKPLAVHDVFVPLFPTQKSGRFSPNTLAQHFSYLDKIIQSHFDRQNPKESPSLADAFARN